MSSDPRVLTEQIGLGRAIFEDTQRAGDNVGKDVVSNMGWIRMLDELRNDLNRKAKRKYEQVCAGDVSELKNMASMLDAGIAASDASLAIADSSYCLLDTAAVSLDRKLRFMESLLRAQMKGASCGTSEASDASPTVGARPRRQASSASSSTTSGRSAASGRNGLLAGAPYRGLIAAALSTTAVGGGSAEESADGERSGSGRGGRNKLARTVGGVLDLQVDPDEPTYCSCEQVAFGEMIACDSPLCPVEWYHCMCVGLTPSNRPMTTWLCPLCAKEAAGGSGGGSQSQNGDGSLSHCAAGAQGSTGAASARSGVHSTRR